MKEAGFTAVELLVTLFVAAGFLIAAYQLFNVVIKDGGQARAETRAGNVAYDYMRRYTPNATNPCTPQTPLTNSPLSVDGLSNAKVTIVITCPQYTTTGLSKVEVTMTYNTPTQTVKYSTFADGTSTGTVDITDGLVGWWKLNGDANTSVGAQNGTVTNATPTIGQNGQANTGYSFNGTSAEITVPNNLFASTVTDFSISIWVKLAAINGVNTVGVVSKDVSAGVSNPPYSLEFTNAGFIWRTTNSTDSTITTSCTTTIPATGVWYHLVGTLSAGTMRFYLNGTACGATPAQTNIAYTTGLLAIGQQKRGFGRWLNGTVDDVRIYNRMLSDSEVTSLYTGGAK